MAKKKKNVSTTNISPQQTESNHDLIDSLSNRGCFFLLLFVGLLMWEWIDALHYVEVPATVMGVSIKTRDVPIFGSKYNAGGTARFYEKWVDVQYSYNDEGYNANILEHKDLTSEHTMVFCHKKHPAKCRSTRLKYPKAHICLILMTGLVLMFMFGFELLESIFKSEFAGFMAGFVLFLSVLAYLVYWYYNL